MNFFNEINEINFNKNKSILITKYIIKNMKYDKNNDIRDDI